jgi:hypothetical protein
MQQNIPYPFFFLDKLLVKTLLELYSALIEPTYIISNSSEIWVLEFPGSLFLYLGIHRLTAGMGHLFDQLNI